jgi:hypothetical protein
VGQVDAVGADVDVAGSFDHGTDIARTLAAEAASCDASTSKSAWGRR